MIGLVFFNLNILVYQNLSIDLKKVCHAHFNAHKPPKSVALHKPPKTVAPKVLVLEYKILTEIYSYLDIYLLYLNYQR